LGLYVFMEGGKGFGFIDLTHALIRQAHLSATLQ